LTELLKQHSDLIEDTQRKHKDTIHELDKTTKRINRRKKTLTTWAKKQKTKYIEELDTQAKEAIERIDTTDKVYSEFMKLKAPAQYWNQKHKDHTTNAKAYRKGLIWFSIISLILLALTAVAFFSPATNIGLWATEDTSHTIILSTLFILISSAAIWAVRIFVRLYLSEHHLSIDAAQRETMTMTYLAMIEENAADTTQRQTIIEALFRPTSDGLVKDDALPGWLVSKYFTNQ